MSLRHKRRSLRAVCLLVGGVAASWSGSLLFAYDVSVLGKAQTMANRGQHEEAVKLYESLIKQEEKDPNLYYYMAVSLKTLGRKEPAFNAYRKAAELEPETSGYKETIAFTVPYGQYCHEIGRPKECLSAYRRILAVVPTLKDNALLNNRWVLVETAEILSAVKEFDLAAKCYAAFQAIAPNSLKDQDLFKAATAYSLANRFDEALQTLKTLEGKYPANLDILLQIADTSIVKGDKTTAQSYANKVLATDPTNTAAKQILEEISK